MSRDHRPRVVLLTGNARRHRFAAGRLARVLPLAGMVVEDKSGIPRPAAESADDQAVIGRHFAERDAVERRLLGEPSPMPATDVLEVGSGDVNDPLVQRWIDARTPDAVVLFGSSIVKDPMLERFEGRVVNLHLGLSPYYRGSATNFWPLVHRMPECVGATIHLAGARVDAGPILAQVRPDATLHDRAHELGTRTLMAALDLLPDAVSMYLDGALAPQEQHGGGRLCRTRDFTAAAVREMWRQFDTGMMPEYLADLDRRRARCPLISLPARAT